MIYHFQNDGESKFQKFLLKIKTCKFCAFIIVVWGFIDVPCVNVNKPLPEPMLTYHQSSSME